MKLLSREFTLTEKLLILVLILLLVGLAYYQFVDQPVRKAIAAAQAEQSALELEYSNLEAKLARVRTMRREMDEIIGGKKATEMGSYNNIKAELKHLNDVLKQSTQYSISIANVTRNGDQIRRNFSLSFSAEDYKMMEHIISQLTESHFRVLIGDLSCSPSGSMKKDPVNVSVTATFYETMVGGTPDAGLPKSEAAAS